MPVFNMPLALRLKMSERRKRMKEGKLDLLSSPRKKATKHAHAKNKQRGHQKRNLLPAFNAAHQDEWVVVALDKESDSDKENSNRLGKKETLTPEALRYQRLEDKQKRAERKREAVLGMRVHRANQMANGKATTAPRSAGGLVAPNALMKLKLDAAASRKESLVSERISRARDLARLRTPRKVRRNSLRTGQVAMALVEKKQLAASERRNEILAGRVKRAADLAGDARRRKEGSPTTEESLKQFKLDELSAKLAAADERRTFLLSDKRKRAYQMGDKGINQSLDEKRAFLLDLLNYKLEAAKERRLLVNSGRVKKAQQMGDRSVLLRINRQRQFMADVLNARLEAAEERRQFLLETKKRVAKVMGGGNLCKALAFEREELSRAMLNLWHLKLEAASARRNIQLIQRKRRAYEMGDEIVRATVEVKLTQLSFALASKQRSAEIRRHTLRSQKVERARQLGDQDMQARRSRLKHKKAQRLMQKLEAAEAKRKSHLRSKSKRAEELGTERVEKSQTSVIMNNCIQGAARIGRLKAAETRRLTNLSSLQTRVARSNARAAAIPNLVEQRQEQEKRMAQRFIAFKMARAEMNRDVMKLLRCGMHGDPTFTLVKPIAFIM